MSGFRVLVLAQCAAAIASGRAQAEPLADTGAAPSLEPREVIGYRRGRPTKMLVVPVDWGEVEVGTARAFTAMREAAARDGVELWVVSGYRSHERQTLLYMAWRAGMGNRAAKPGTSNHQSGRALDLDLYRPGAQAWLDANARRWRFKRTVRGEPWHWEFKGKRPRVNNHARGTARRVARHKRR